MSEFKNTYLIKEKSARAGLYARNQIIGKLRKAEVLLK